VVVDSLDELRRPRQGLIRAGQSCDIPSGEQAGLVDGLLCFRGVSPDI
jgi:hypothetical protein